MLRESSESLPQRVLITLLAEFSAVFPGPIASSILVDILEDFGISKDATRTALSRLVTKSLFVRTKKGRKTSYALSEKANQAIQEDRDRILEFGENQTWDQKWTMVAFSVSESQKHKRHVLRSQLRGLGFAPLFDGLWAAAFATEQDAYQALDVAQVTESLVARSEIKAFGKGFGDFYAAWKLDELEADYRRFIEAIRPVVARAESGEVAPAEALLVRTRIMNDWRLFPINDPNLPEELLPSNWPRKSALQLFRAAYEALQPPAELRLNMLLSRND